MFLLIYNLDDELVSDNFVFLSARCEQLGIWLGIWNNTGSEEYSIIMHIKTNFNPCHAE